ncbi:MAG TPA: DNA mismatch repair protein MutS [Deltaproteobacteria bacterium]|nr:DNA mismatch repair protein MutS [Deltaproteobacteria bacterium]
MGNLTPMMQQYLDIKRGYQDTILFYRMGDFYEMFHDDAVHASRILGIALTTRDKGRENPVPMCGVPCHAASAYISRLIRLGNKVAVCEQAEIKDGAKGLVPREVVQVITPGLMVEDDHLSTDRANYLMAMSCQPKGNLYGIAFIDISTGDFRVTEVKSRQEFEGELSRISPSEIITCDPQHIPEGFYVTRRDDPMEASRARDILASHFRTQGVEGLGLRDHEEALKATGIVLDYVGRTQKNVLGHIISLRFYNTGRYMMLGANTKRNLELFESISGNASNTLFSVMNRTRTPMGARTLADWMSFPLMDEREISARYDALEELAGKRDTLDEIRGLLDGIPDLERIVGRISAGKASPRDIISLGAGLDQVPEIKDLAADLESRVLAELMDRMNPQDEVRSKIRTTIVPEPPGKIGDGNVIAAGVDRELDELRLLKTDSRQWIASLETEERASSGINTLKIGYNRVFGYYIEITKAHADKAPQHYIRKQTLVNAERFITPELKEYEAKLLGAQDAIYAIEMRILGEMRDFLMGHVPDLKATIQAVAYLDAVANLACLAIENGYSRPKIRSGRDISMDSGRHPVVEKVLKTAEFVPNSCMFDGDRDTVHIITGPNMAGKSTFMRQIALIAIMAQMGSFVPARQAQIGIVDRIFTRVGALDNLSAGQSTFLVEMSETAEILNSATPQSLVILDEIGRGTSTYDGMSLAWAVVEFLDSRKIRTFFATHYHELADLARRHTGIKNFHMAVEESGHDVVFLREVKRGAIGRSYGIYVARLAGIPDEVIDNARIILANIGKKARQVPRVNLDAPVQVGMFEDKAPDILREIIQVDIESLRPIDALNLLNALKEKILKAD